MAGSITVSSITLDSDNNFSIKSNTGATLFFANTTGIDIANSIGATAITSDKILSIANTKITGNITSSQITSDLTLYGNVSVTGTLAATGAVTTPLSYVRLNTANGYGSTNTVIRRFTNIVNSVGTDITYADSATLGATFTINTSGVYSASYNDSFVSGADMGMSINSTQLTTNIVSITVTDRLIAATATSTNILSCVSATFYAAAASVVRAHTDAAASGAAPIRTNFTIARVQ